MYFSKHNIFAKISNSENYFIINLLTGNADILSPEKALEIIEQKYTAVNEYFKKGYLADPTQEKILFNAQYLNFLKSRDSEELQIFFVPWYSCNFNCSYCYQASYPNSGKELTKEIIDAFFIYITSEFHERRKYITLFGGEPLLAGTTQKELLKYLLGEAKRLGIAVAVVTNGYNLAASIGLLKTASIREIQVTLDGTKEVHDKRRFLHNGSGTFAKIVKGIDLSLSAGFPVNLRVILDKTNFGNLPSLAKFAISKGWTNNPLFKTQLGRNYELHKCHNDSSSLFERIGLYEELYALVLNQPELLEFHKPAFSISKFLAQNGELPKPLFDACPGCKTEWAFDFTGSLYPCTATVGKPEEKIGSFYHRQSKNDTLIAQWEDRDVTSIEKCHDCSLQLACGGGCGSVAKNATGALNTPDCRPIKELLALGMAIYFNPDCYALGMRTETKEAEAFSTQKARA